MDDENNVRTTRQNHPPNGQHHMTQNQHLSWWSRGPPQHVDIIYMFQFLRILLTTPLTSRSSPSPRIMRWWGSRRHALRRFRRSRICISLIAWSSARSPVTRRPEGQALEAVAIWRACGTGRLSPLSTSAPAALPEVDRQSNQDLPRLRMVEFFAPDLNRRQTLADWQMTYNALRERI
jgi:hypothetical protein